MRKDYLIFLGLLVLGFAVYTRYRETAEPRVDSSRARPEIQLLPAKSAPRSSTVQAGITPAEHGRMMALGIRQTVLPRNSLESINIRFKQKPQRCVVGDLDFVKAQTVKPDQAEWRLSLEQDSPVSSVDVSLENMLEGDALKLDFPPRDGLYALYLCKNSERGSCLDQDLWNPSQRSTQRLKGVLINAQILLRKEGRIMVLPTDDWSRGTIDRLKGVLPKHGPRDVARLDSLYTMIGRIKPFAAQFDEQGLVLPLGINNLNCGR